MSDSIKRFVCGCGKEVSGPSGLQGHLRYVVEHEGMLRAIEEHFNKSTAEVEGPWLLTATHQATDLLESLIKHAGRKFDASLPLSSPLGTPDDVKAGDWIDKTQFDKLFGGQE